MTAFVDTNILIRHLTGEPPELAALASACLTTAEDLVLVDLILAEAVYVLESYYRTPRSQIADVLRALLALPSIRAQGRPLLIRALEVYEVDRLDFADAYLVACAESTGVGAVASFDRGIDRISTVTRIEPGAG